MSDTEDTKAYLEHLQKSGANDPSTVLLMHILKTQLNQSLKLDQLLANNEHIQASIN